MGGIQLGVALDQEAADWDRGDGLWEVVGTRQALGAQDPGLGMIEGQNAEAPAAVVAEVLWQLNVQVGHLA